MSPSVRKWPKPCATSTSLSPWCWTLLLGKHLPLFRGFLSLPIPGRALRRSELPIKPHWAVSHLLINSCPTQQARYKLSTVWVEAGATGLRDQARVPGRRKGIGRARCTGQPGGSQDHHCCSMPGTAILGQGQTVMSCECWGHLPAAGLSQRGGTQC